MQGKYLLTILLAIFIIMPQVKGATYSYTACLITHYLHTANLLCTTCPANQESNNYQGVATACQCQAGYRQPANPNINACTAAFTTACTSPTTNYYPVLSTDGSATVINADCVACSPTSFPNINASSCTYCGPGMTFSSTQGCVCTNSANILSDLGCFTTTLSPTVTSSAFSTQLKYLFTACLTFTDPLSCSMIVNLCAYSEGATTAPECQFFVTNSLTTQLYGDSAGFTLNPSQLSLTMKLVSFSSTGNYLGEKILLLGDLMRCGTPSDSEVRMTFGTNIETSCEFNFNHLLNQISSRQYQGKLYQILVLGDSGSYFDVPVYMSGSTQPIKRFFLEDTFSVLNRLKVATSLKLEFTFSGGVLISPKLTPTYTTLSTEIGVGVVGTSTLSLSYSFLFNSDLGNFYTGALISFLVVAVAALVHAIIKTYISFLNRKSALLFFINFAGVFSLWLFYYLFFMSGYWFLFTKTTSLPFLLLPPSDPTLYPTFYALVAIMVIFRVIFSLKQKSDKLSTEVYLINWERGQFRNSWRQIFIVNSLAQFYTYRTVSIFWMLVVLLFFVTGIQWEDLAAETTSTSETFYETLIPINRILLYFLCSSIFLAVGFVFKIIRRVSVLFWPLPFEDFVDYCTVTNISFVFIKKRAPHAYYLHASLPDHTDVTYREINDAIRRGLQKQSRSLENEVSLDKQRVYSIYLSKEMEDRHTQMLKKLEEKEHAQRVKYTKESAKKQKVNPRQQFIEGRLKPHIQGVACAENDQHRKSFAQNFCGTPPIDLRQEGGRGRSLIFFDDSLELVSEVFPNGNEFEQIHTLIAIFLGFATLTGSAPIAAFLTYFVDTYMINAWIGWSCRNNLEEMTRVKKGFMI